MYLDGIFSVEVMLPHGYAMNIDGVNLLERALEAARRKYSTRLDDHSPRPARLPSRAPAVASANASSTSGTPRRDRRRKPT